MGKVLAEPPSHTNTWVSGADLLRHIPELLVADTGSQGHSEESSKETLFVAHKTESGQALPSHDSTSEHQEGEALDRVTEIAGETQELRAPEAGELDERSRSEDVASVGQTDIVEQVALDSSPTKDLSGAEEGPPAKPPRHLTMEPDIVASTKKPSPARPPPPASVPPPRPPPPARPAPPPRKKKSDLEIEVQKIPGLEGKCLLVS